MNMSTGCSDINRSILDSEVSSSSNDRLVEAVEEDNGGGAVGGTVRSTETSSLGKFHKPCIFFIREKVGVLLMSTRNEKDHKWKYILGVTIAIMT